MPSDLTWRAIAFDARARKLERRWKRLCALYLPHAQGESLWLYHYAKRPHRRTVGWKLHISATILNAPSVLNRIAPFLTERGVQFKAPRSLGEVLQLNSGLYYRYSQIGKIITVYPANDDEAVGLAKGLHELTRRFTGPSIPFDLRFNDSSNVYYRYGAFEHLEIEQNGHRTHAVYAPNGDLVPDVREEPKPDWISDPFEPHRPISRKKKVIPFEPIRALRVLSQRGKGGVYEAIDLTGDVPRPCLLKEGRMNGEVTWDGRDGVWRIKNEARVLARLSAAGVTVPAIRSSFELGGNYYLVMEYLDGETLHSFLYRLRRRLPLVRVADYGLQLAMFLSQMHRAGWVWRDCKPKNIIVTREGRLVPIDFEGAARINQPDHLQWGTPGFTPPEWRDRKTLSSKTDDLFSLGAMIYLLLTGRIFEPHNPVAIDKLRRNIPVELRQLTELLLSTKKSRRPSAAHAAQILNAISLKLSTQPAGLVDVKAA